MERRKETRWHKIDITIICQQNCTNVNNFRQDFERKKKSEKRKKNKKNNKARTKRI